MKLISKKPLLIGLVIGLGFISLSFFWPMIHPVASQWTEADQAKLAEAAGEFHAKQPKASQWRENGDPNADRIEADFRHWKQEWQKNMSKLESIQGRSSLIVNIFYYLGIGFAVASTAGLVYIREDEPKN